MFSNGSLEERVPSDHPLRLIREMVDAAPNDMNPRSDVIYGEDGRKSIPPERLLRALLVQLLYSLRSERVLMEQLQHNLLFRWFVAMAANQPMWHPTVFTKSRDRLPNGAVSEEFCSLIAEQGRTKKLLSDEPFTVDGTLIEAWAGQKSFQRKKSNHDILNPRLAIRGTIRPSTGTSRSAGTTRASRSLILLHAYSKGRGAPKPSLPTLAMC